MTELDYPLMPLDTGVCDCAGGCGQLLLGERTALRLTEGLESPADLRAALRGYPPPVAGRVGERPYCRDCLQALRRRRWGRNLTRGEV